MNNITIIQKYDPNKVIVAVYHDGESGNKYVKRFIVTTKTISNRFKFISDSADSKLIASSADPDTVLNFSYWTKNNIKKNKTIDLDSFVPIKGWKSKGNLLGQYIRPSRFSILESDNTKTDNLSQGSLFDSN